jgi:NADH-quinone oxidoreductase subunit L
MKNILHLFLILPLLGFLVSTLIPSKREGWISGITYFVVGVNLVVGISFVLFWIYIGHPTLNIKDVSVYSNLHYNFFLDFYFDKVSAVYFLIGAFLTFLVTIYSRYYMHRDVAYKRFFNNILFFYVGYNITVLSGNFETLFIGWEILGVSSFLMIAFYRERYLPVKNAIKVFTIYRFGDIGILLAMWMMHHLWHDNITFLKLTNKQLVHEHLASHSMVGVLISLMILTAAAAKSAQLPFTAWLPRAMEGPTPSSAIFYGSLSVHVGALLLFRTFSFWENQISIKVLIILIGLSTTIIASLIARVQSSIKGQVAYASAAQIGIIFIEIALGFQQLALIHFAGNAFLRTYQLLISPSVVAYMIREQFYTFQPKHSEKQKKWNRKFKNTVYLLSLKEWYLDRVIFLIFVGPLKKMRSWLSFLTIQNLLYFFIPAYLIGFYFAYVNQPISEIVRSYLSAIMAFVALLMVSKAYNERSSSRLTWLLIVMAHFFIDLAINFNEHFNGAETLLYLSGVIVSGSLGFYCLQKVRMYEHNRVGLNEFHGLVYKYPKLAFLFLVSCLGLAGFPITPTFLGEDVILTHVHQNQVFLAFFIAFTFIINGISLIRIYARIFLGPHVKTYQHKTDISI